MKKDGTIVIEGKDITINGSGKINVKASSDITMKGSQIKRELRATMAKTINGLTAS